jgi:hypothetical protein
LAGEEGGLTLTALSRLLKRPTGQTRTLLRRLMEVDLVTQQGNLYDFRDPGMKLWAAYYYQGLELPAVPRKEILDQLVAEVSQRYQRISSELGHARESQIRESMRHFAGQVVDGSLFGLEGAFTLPRFTSVTPYQSPEIELDALAENNELWVVEVKWRNEPASRKEVETFRKKADTVLQNRRPRLWFVSKAGFRESAMRFAREKGILFSSQTDLQALAERVGMRFDK